MTDDKIINELKNGTCPFTGQRYDCARCEITPEHHRTPTGKPGEYRSLIHMSLCITGYIRRMSKQEFRKLAKSFFWDDGTPMTPTELMDYFLELYKLGVETIPLNNKCNRFCFKHGCMGDII